MIRDVKLDLGRRLGLEIGKISMRDLTDTTWRDLSLGCPRQGQAYGQVAVPGYRITLSAAGRDYVYHTDRRNKFVLCSSPNP